MNKIRKIFTKWYIKRGYTFSYDFTDVAIFDDGFMQTPVNMPRAVWDCPWWVRPLLIFWSPSTYMIETTFKWISEGILKGIGDATLKGE